MDDVIQKSTTTANTAIITLPGVYLGHCTVSFSIYGFRWLMWYLQTFILNVFCMFRSLDSNKMLGYSTEFAWKKIPIIFVENKIHMQVIWILIITHTKHKKIIINNWFAYIFVFIICVKNKIIYHFSHFLYIYHTRLFIHHSMFPGIIFSLTAISVIAKGGNMQVMWMIIINTELDRTW